MATALATSVVVVTTKRGTAPPTADPPAQGDVRDEGAPDQEAGHQEESNRARGRETKKSNRVTNLTFNLN